ncbi:flagellar hook-length control protein FliK [Devosia sp.]|uniref:flagellar hook-length control protein FliK n=1 Tax=Devosia sp. TaxID=1871048 RepID=UPI003262FE62
MIPTQIPAQLAIKSGATQTLALKPGQVFEAIVTGTNAAGVTEVLLGKQQMAVTLASIMAPGTKLQLRVDMTSAGLRFVVTGQTPPTEQQAGAAPILTQATPPQNSTVPQQPRLPSAPTVQPTAQPQVAVTDHPQEQATIINRQPAEPARPGALQTQSLKPGQIIEARVVGQTPSGDTEVTVGKQQLTLPLPNSPAAGTILQLRAEATPVGQRLVVVAQTPPQPQGVASPVPQQATPTTTQPNLQVSTTAPGSGLAAEIARSAMPQAAVTQNVATRAQAAVSMPVQSPAAPMPQTEQAAVAQMVQLSAGRQNTTTTLMSGLQALAQSQVPLPAPVAKAAAQVLATRTELNPQTLTGAVLQKAVLASGVFQESLLAAGTAPSTPQGDVKSALLSLRSALVSWLGPDGAVVMPHMQRQPPVRGSGPRAQREAADFGPLSGSPEDIGKAVLDRTEGALARLRLHQHASLPDQSVRSGSELNLEIPVTINQQQSVLQMQVSRDGGGGNSAAQESERSWQIRFAMDLQNQGEVGAQVGLRGQKASVLLWAAEEATAQQLRGLLPQLGAELAAAGLDIGSISVRSGVPAAPARASGGLVDAVR